MNPQVTSALLTIAAAGRGRADVLTAEALDEQAVTHDTIGLRRLAAYAQAANDVPSARDTLAAENHHRTAKHLRALRQELFGTGPGAMPLEQAQARAAGFQLRWNPDTCARR